LSQHTLFIYGRSCSCSFTYQVKNTNRYSRYVRPFVRFVHSLTHSLTYSPPTRPPTYPSIHPSIHSLCRPCFRVQSS